MNSKVTTSNADEQFLLVHALRTCRRKATRKNYQGDKLMPEERITFNNCLEKYFQTPLAAKEGIRIGSLEIV